MLVASLLCAQTSSLRKKCLIWDLHWRAQLITRQLITQPESKERRLLVLPLAFPYDSGWGPALAKVFTVRVELFCTPDNGNWKLSHGHAQN